MNTVIRFLRCHVLALLGYGVISLAVLVLGACSVAPPDTGGGGGGTVDPMWQSAFDTSDVGALSAVWGSANDDVFSVGGQPEQGEIYHYDGTDWTAMVVPEVPLLVWVFGFGPGDVYAVGEGGGVLQYDGSTWTRLDPGTDQDLWGVWGRSPSDIWIVGGNVGEGDPVILSFDGTTFTDVPAPENDRNATALFKVWGIGSKVFAVGESGLIVELADGAWAQVPAGANASDDFVSLWGTSEDNIVAVGGRGSARIARYDGQSWQTDLLSGISGLNAVFMVEPDVALIGGTNGYLGRYNPMTQELEDELSFTNRCIHGIWTGSDGVSYAVGGRFSPPLAGTALVRR